MKKHVILVLWVLFTLAIFLWTWSSYASEADAQLRSEILLRHGLLMLGLTLPSGWLLSALVSSIMLAFKAEATGLNEAILISVTCAIAGYLQWLVLVPWLWRRWKEKRSRTAEQA